MVGGIKLNVAVETSLSAIPGKVAKALIVVGLKIVSGIVNRGEEVLGMLPSIVK
jgi:hypothetical protein